MDNIAGTKSGLTWAVHMSVVLLVALWLFPTLGLFVSSFRTADQIASSGWWQAMFPTEQNLTLRTADPDDDGVQQLADGVYTVSGNLFVVEGMADSAESSEANISVWGTTSRDIAAYQPGETADLGDGETMTVQANGDYVWTGTQELSGRGQRAFVTATTPPEFTTAN